MNKIEIYSWGLCYCSVCVPKEMFIEEVEAKVNLEMPTGVRSKWEKAEEDFRTGQSNPCECEKNTNRVHYLLSC